MIQITNKRDMLELMHRGAFGVSMRTWYSIEALLADPPESGMVGIRNLTVSAALMKSHLTIVEAVCIATKCQAEGAKLYFQESPPTEHCTIQGEISYVDGILTFFYSRAKLPMRPALAMAGQHEYGFKVLWLLKNELTFDSYNDINELLETYEDHVIEFTAFNRCVGWAKGRNMCVWEVRLF
jgi:hypothetical protein